MINCTYYFILTHVFGRSLNSKKGILLICYRSYSLYLIMLYSSFFRIFIMSKIKLPKNRKKNDVLCGPICVFVCV